jgi:hypothetical protein
VYGAPMLVKQQASMTAWLEEAGETQWLGT